MIRRVVRDLNLDLTVRSRVLPTVRDADGLALSSRNVLLSAAERAAALRALSPCAEALRRGDPRPHAQRWTGSTSTTSRSPTSTRLCSPPPYASAPPD